MMGRANLGVDFGPAALRAAVVKKKRGGLVTERCRVVPVSADVLRIFDISDTASPPQEKLVDKLRELLDPIAEGEERISLSLPDIWGRLHLVEVKSGFKNKEEGRDFLRWRLKAMLPFAPEDIHLDFQVLKKPSAGAGLVLVSLIPRQVVETISDVCESAGYFPVVIDFHGLNCLNYYYSRLDWEENLSLIIVEDENLSFFYFRDGLLGYHRSHRISPKRDRIFDDIRLSIIDCEKRFPSLRRGAVYLHTDDKDGPALLEGIKPLFSGRGILLKTDLEEFFQTGNAAVGSLSQNQAAAIGAAFRLLRAV
ncbi:MAG: pilus assembly protein PilM [Desulfuromonadaceae bacterium]|nr:pilus assembly protein PilM [Desulfuromonadaceae bacterium]